MEVLRFSFSVFDKLYFSDNTSVWCASCANIHSSLPILFVVSYQQQIHTERYSSKRNPGFAPDNDIDSGTSLTLTHVLEMLEKK